MKIGNHSHWNFWKSISPVMTGNTNKKSALLKREITRYKCSLDRTLGGFRLKLTGLIDGYFPPYEFGKESVNYKT